ncbi:MAG: hypothetical protein PHU21_12430 [Elusimicrobia bacterium]|nr:hypothetical protein [Elusimicrobiota bacterium]
MSSRLAGVLLLLGGLSGAGLGYWLIRQKDQEHPHFTGVAVTFAAVLLLIAGLIAAFLSLLFFVGG